MAEYSLLNFGDFMAWLDFLKNGNELSELLIEGNNPYSAHLLRQADVDQMRNHIQPNERVLGYVLGRVVLSGRGLWLLTDRHLLVSENDTDTLVHHFALKDITQAECVKGKYGYTLRVTAAGQQRSVYGASSHLAAVFYRALGQKVSYSPVYKPTALDADDVCRHQTGISPRPIHRTGNWHAQPWRVPLLRGVGTSPAGRAHA